MFDIRQLLGGGNGGGIVATPEQIAQSRMLEEALGLPSNYPAQAPEGEPIIVQGARSGMGSPESIADVPPPAMGNLDYIEEARGANANAPEHKGMFGVKGTLRDVLGILGDAFLVNAGRDKVYAPRRQQEREGDALSGFTQNPLAAIERMAQVNADKSMDLNETYGTQQARDQANRIAQMNAQRQMFDTSNDNYAKGFEIMSQMMGSVNPETYGYARPIMENLAKRYGLTDITLPESYDEAVAQFIGNSGMKRSQQITTQQGERRLDQGDARIGIAQQNADSQRISATRPRAGRAPAQPTEAAEIARIRATLNKGGQLSAGDQATWQKYISGGRSGRGTAGGRRPVTPSSRFRPVR